MADNLFHLVVQKHVIDHCGPHKVTNVAHLVSILRATKTGAIYLTVHNKSGAEALLFAVDSSVARTTAVHATLVDNGVASMSPVPGGLSLASHGEVMRPGGVHIMLTGLPDSLAVGGTLSVKMVFRDAGLLESDVPIIPFGAGDPTEQHTKH